MDDQPVTSQQTTAEALYRPVRTVLAYRVPENDWDATGSDEEPEEETPVERLALLIRSPNAMRPAGWDKAGPGPESELLARLGRNVPVPGRWMAYDTDGAFLGAMTDSEFLATWSPGSHDPYIHYAFAGEERTLHLGPDGLLIDDAGRELPDMRRALAGLARIDEDGQVLVAADAPLAMQAAALLDAEDEEFARHLVHVFVTAQVLARDGGADPGSWVDLSRFNDLMDDVSGRRAAAPGVDVEVPSARDLAEEMLIEVDASFADDPMWALGLAWGTRPQDWLSRDTPGSGALWSVVERALAGLGVGGVVPGPNADAQCIVFDADDDAPPAVKAWFAARGTTVSTDEVLVTGEGDGLHAALVRDGDFHVALAWLGTPAANERRDPLMAEALAGFAIDVDGVANGPGRTGLEAREILSELDMLDVLPDPATYPGYASAVFAKAHADGAGLPGLCASLASLLREGLLDGAFMTEGEGGADGTLTPSERASVEAAASRADRAGGTAHPLLTAMLCGVEPEQWDDVEVNRDLTTLLDACRLGATLLDLSDVVAELEDDDLP